MLCVLPSKRVFLRADAWSTALRSLRVSLRGRGNIASLIFATQGPRLLLAPALVQWLCCCR